MRKSVQTLADRVLKREHAAAKAALAEARSHTQAQIDAIAALRADVVRERDATTAMADQPLAAASFAEWHRAAAVRLAEAEARLAAAEAACLPLEDRLLEIAARLHGLELFVQEQREAALRRAEAADPVGALGVLRAITRRGRNPRDPA